ncbi:hypothetical protein CK203_056670 [Vitis vinifera]|uniref:Retrotransposon gag domain-containing protein n=1 Tax=Vitis vinifera TaxID=29760 RepID=A0A438GNT6_VITVI|nr:hypothetical protein CK203_056670 [Vitis vinifera]
MFLIKRSGWEVKRESNGVVAGDGATIQNCNLCMPYWIRDQEGRLVRIENPQDTELDICVNIMDPPPEDQNSQQGQGVGYKTHIVPLLPTFHGMESENPYSHIKEFEEDKAKIWLNSLRPRSIRNWVDLQAEYMEAINACPHHGFDTWLLVSYFYDGMSSSMKQILETMCGGDFMSKNPEEAMDFLSYVAEVSRGWDEPNQERKENFPLNNPNPKAGMYMLSEDVDIKAKVATIARRLEELELKKMHEVQAISETQAHAMPCTICQSCDHVVDECPTMPAVREMLGDQVNVVGQFRPNNSASYGNTYNSSWRNHPIFLETKTTSIPTTRPNPSTSANIFSGASHSLHGKKEIKNSSEILEVLRQVKVNIPLLDMIKQVPTYAKFLKDLCTVKRGLQVTKNAFLTEQVSAIIQNLGASVNLLPYSVYKQLGLGGLKPTTMTLSLADRHLYPEEEEGFEEVCLINTLVEEHCDKSLEESLNENLEVLEDGFPEPFDVLAIMSPWRRREEILPLFNQEDSQGVAVEDPPKLI